VFIVVTGTLSFNQSSYMNTTKGWGNCEYGLWSKPGWKRWLQKSCNLVPRVINVHQDLCL